MIFHSLIESTGSFVPFANPSSGKAPLVNPFIPAHYIIKIGKKTVANASAKTFILLPPAYSQKVFLAVAFYQLTDIIE